MMARNAATRLPLWLAALVPALSQAAGGHHAVDDAALIDAGTCLFESWVDRERASRRSLLHAGPVCRVGAVEFGVAVDRQRLRGDGTTSSLNAQLKWATALDDRLSIGAVLMVSGQDRAPGGPHAGVVLPLTWRLADSLLAHVNVGRDFRRREADHGRAGVALEWSPLANGSLVAERFREGGVGHWRLGGRWAVTPSLQLDLSRAGGMNGGAPPWWTLGVTWVFDR